ncbi:prephenate dehydrogenase [Acidaminobacterium chupaoyuni]
MPSADLFSPVGVIGLGLIGGSMVKAIRLSKNCRIYASDLSETVMQSAAADGSIDGVLDSAALASCRLLLLGLYPQAAVETMRAAAKMLPRGGVVVDLCGVKRAVSGPLAEIAAENGLYYVGGHPMAGMEHSGYAHSRADLFLGASMILTPTPGTPQPLLEALETFFLSLDFDRVCFSTPEQHDRVIALTSQLAHVISCAYIGSPTAMEFSGFSAGSFRDMTRVARLNETMWTELFFENADYLAEEIDGMARRLGDFAACLQKQDQQAMFSLLHNSRLRKEKTDAMCSPAKGETP